MTTKNCANGPKLVLKVFVRNVLYLYWYLFFQHHNLLYTPTYPQQVTQDDSLPTTNQVTP